MIQKTYTFAFCLQACIIPVCDCIACLDSSGNLIQQLLLPEGMVQQLSEGMQPKQLANTVTDQQRLVSSMLTATASAEAEDSFNAEPAIRVVSHSSLLYIADAARGALLQHAVQLLDPSSDPHARACSIIWIAKMTYEAQDAALCAYLTETLKVAERAVRLLKLDSEAVTTHEAVLWLCLDLHRQQQLPVGELLEAGVHEQLAAFIISSGMSHKSSHYACKLRNTAI